MRHLFDFKKAFFALFLSLSSISNAASVEGSSEVLTFKALPNDFSFIRIYGPNGYFSETSDSSLNVKKPLDAGQYRYQVFGNTKATPKQDLYKQTLNNGRNTSIKPSKEVLGSLVQGYFHIIEGRVVVGKNIKE